MSWVGWDGAKASLNSPVSLVDSYFPGLSALPGFTLWLRLGAQGCHSAVVIAKMLRAWNQILMGGPSLPWGQMSRLCSSTVLGQSSQSPPPLTITLSGCGTLGWLIFHFLLTAWKCRYVTNAFRVLVLQLVGHGLVRKKQAELNKPCNCAYSS